MGFTKLDSGIVDSSLWSEPPITRVVWITMLAKSDRNGLVRCSRDALFRASNVPILDFDSAIARLESPDGNSRSSCFDGRRIEKVEGGWLILNYLRYRSFSVSDEPEAVRKRNYRTTKNGTCPKVSQSVLGHSVSASANNKDGDARGRMPNLEEVKLYCAKTGLPETDAIWFWNKCEGNGWTNGGKKIVSWTHTIAAWKAASIMPSQRNGNHSVTNGASTVILGQEYQRIIARMNTIKCGYGDMQTWTNGDKKEFLKLKTRRDELKKILGITI